MADDDQSSADPGKPGSPGDPNVPEDAPKGEKAETAPEVRKAIPVEVRKAQPATQEDKEWQAMQDHLDQIMKDAQTRGQAMQAALQPELDRYRKMFGQEQGLGAPPEVANVPPPPTEQQKGGLAEFVVNLLKFSVLGVLAFGMGARHGASAAIYKGAIGAALGGYLKGRKEFSDASMQLWEKNREVMNDTNRQQMERYRAILEDTRLGLETQFNLLGQTAKLYGDQKTAADAERKDLIDLQSSMAQQRKEQQDKEKFEIDHRDKIYDVLDKKEMTAQYLEWLYQKSKGKIALTGKSSADEFYKVEKEHPEWSYSAFLKWYDEQELKKAFEKSKAESRGRKAGEEEEEKGDKSGAKAKAADDLLNSMGFH